MERRKITTIEELKIFIEEFDHYCFNSYHSTVFFSYSYSQYANQTCNVEGEALEFLLSEEAASEKRRAEEIRLEEEREKAEKEAQAFKYANGGVFEFAAFANGRWFDYEFAANTLEDAERIGWEKLEKDTAHWKGGSANLFSVKCWYCR